MMRRGDAGFRPQAEMGVAGLTPVGSTSGDFAGHLRKQTDEYARVIRDAGIKGE